MVTWWHLFAPMWQIQTAAASKFHTGRLRAEPIEGLSGIRWHQICAARKRSNVSELLIHWYGYGSIPINTNFRGMNIHLPAILMFTRGTRFWHTAIYSALLRDRHTWYRFASEIPISDAPGMLTHFFQVGDWPVRKTSPWVDQVAGWWWPHLALFLTGACNVAKPTVLLNLCLGYVYRLYTSKIRTNQV